MNRFLGWCWWLGWGCRRLWLGGITVEEASSDVGDGLSAGGVVTSLVGLIVLPASLVVGVKLMGCCVVFLECSASGAFAFIEAAGIAGLLFDIVGGVAGEVVKLVVVKVSFVFDFCGVELSPAAGE